jgi:hypothetical protein
MKREILSALLALALAAAAPACNVIIGESFSGYGPRSDARGPDPFGEAGVDGTSDAGRGGAGGAPPDSGAGGSGPGTGATDGGAERPTYVGPPVVCASTVPAGHALLADFSPVTWDSLRSLWGAPGGVQGDVFAYAGPASNMMMVVDPSAQNAIFMGSVATADYAGGGLGFLGCVNVRGTYTGVRFTLGGDAAGCNISFVVQTYEQQGTTFAGGCNTEGSQPCYQFPRVTVPAGPGPVTVHFTDLAGTGIPPGAADIAGEVVGLQWQFESPGIPQGANPPCPGIAVTLDDVAFVTD